MHTYRALVVERWGLVVVDMIGTVATNVLGQKSSSGADGRVPLALDRLVAVQALRGSSTAGSPKEVGEAGTLADGWILRSSLSLFGNFLIFVLLNSVVLRFTSKFGRLTIVFPDLGGPKYLAVQPPVCSHSYLHLVACEPDTPNKKG